MAMAARRASAGKQVLPAFVVELLWNWPSFLLTVGEEVVGKIIEMVVLASCLIYRKYSVDWKRSNEWGLRKAVDMWLI